jgi:TRAP-type C4-dicarboxylate transport system permease small subunit
MKTEQISKAEWLLIFVLEKATFISLLGLVIIVLLQIITRFLPFSVPVWTEEASRILFIYAVAFSAGLALKDKHYVNLDVFYNSLSRRFQSIVQVLNDFAVVLLFGIFCWQSFYFVGMGFAETSPSIKITMAIPFLSMTILSITVCFYALKNFWQALKNRKL